MTQIEQGMEGFDSKFDTTTGNIKEPVKKGFGDLNFLRTYSEEDGIYNSAADDGKERRQQRALEREGEFIVGDQAPAIALVLANGGTADIDFILSYINQYGGALPRHPRKFTKDPVIKEKYVRALVGAMDLSMRQHPIIKSMKVEDGKVTINLIEDEEKVREWKEKELGHSLALASDFLAKQGGNK